jgi:hypothetical protein
MSTNAMMDSLDRTFCLSLQREAHKLVKQHFPKVNLVTDAWTYHFNRDHWEFHGPDNFYWNGNAANAYDCRYKGWMAWLRSKGIEE